MASDVEMLSQILSNEGAVCGDCATEPGDWRDCSVCTKVLRWYADAILASDWLAQREATLRSSIAAEIEARAPEWEYAGGVARDAWLRAAETARGGAK